MMSEYSSMYTLISQRVWILADSRPGTANQVLGIAEALGIPFSTKYIQYKAIAVLPNIFLNSTVNTVTSESYSTLEPPWPDVIIVAGRRAALTGRWIKRQATHQVLLVQIMFPGKTNLSDFDLIILPDHDLPQYSKNIVRVLGAPNHVTLEALSTAASYWSHHLAVLPRPWVACLVGGTNGYHSLSRSLAHVLALKSISVAGRGSILLTTSRRTAKSTVAEMTRVFISSGVSLFIYDWNKAHKINPYLGFLSLADAIIVTGDSISMCTEACAQTKPVFIFAPMQWIKFKQTRLHTELFRYGYARPLLQKEINIFNWQHPPLNSTKYAAEVIKIQLIKKLKKQNA